MRVIGAIQDITEQKKLQKQIVEQEQKLKRKLVKSIIEAQENERRHLSVELHDNVNQLLTSCKLMLEYAKENETAAKHLIEKAYQSISTVIQEVRLISHDLNPSLIQDMGLLEAIEQLVEKINLTQKLKVHFYTNSLSRIFKEAERMVIYRIVQEQVNNILKHAQASTVVIQLLEKNGYVNLSISDNGIGFNQKSVKLGLGLRSIKNRVDYCNGTMKIHSSPGKGTMLGVIFKTSD